MYNLYKFRQDQAQVQSQKIQQQHYAQWLLKHQAIKSYALDKRKQRLNQFIEEYKDTNHVFQDDHYKIWRYNKQFRDIEDQTKFVGFKSFRHKPHYEVNKIFNERERIQIANNSARAHALVQQNKIPDQLRARSLRSQGPLNPKHSFREKKADHQYLQPRMRYTNITDKQRFMQRSITLDDKFKDVYKSFQMMKSSIGKASIKPNNQAKSLQKNKFDFIEEVQSNMAESKPFFYEAENPQEVDNPSASKILGQTTKLSFGQGENKKRKTYFKLARALAVEGHPQAKDLMVKTQYVRSKDLSNITKNLSCQGHNKRPIL